MKPKKKITARLVHYNQDVTRTWYIDFMVPDSQTGEPKRCRYKGEINQYKKLGDRLVYAQKVLKTIQDQIDRGTKYLGPGFAFGSLENEIQDKVDKASLQQAFRMYYSEKLGKVEKATTNRILATLKLIEEFEMDHRKILFSQVRPAHVEKLLSWIRESKDIEPKTYNHYRNTLSGCYNFFIKKGATIQNPVKGVPTMKVQKGKMHFPLTLEEVAKIKQYALDRGDHQFVLFMSLCFYALIRPGKELRLMRVRDIDQSSIWVNAENAKTDESRRVEMVAPLRKLILTTNLQQYHPNDYLFTQSGHPGKVPVGPGYFYKKQKRFLKALGLADRGHDLYCYKHSGAIQMIKAGFTPFDVMKMAGHKNVQQTMDYLYNIGAITRLGEKANQMPEI